MRLMLGPWRVRRRSKRVTSSEAPSPTLGLSLSFSGLGLILLWSRDLIVGGNWR